jgi:hypothetical protein
VSANFTVALATLSVDWTCLAGFTPSTALPPADQAQSTANVACRWSYIVLSASSTCALETATFHVDADFYRQATTFRGESTSGNPLRQRLCGLVTSGPAFVRVRVSGVLLHSTSCLAMNTLASAISWQDPEGRTAVRRKQDTSF